MNPFLFAGAAQTDITPPLGTIVNGEMVAYYAHTIHDPLYSKALVLKDDSNTIAIIMVDICVMDADFIDEVKNDIFLKTQIPPENILIAATHTHFAGSIADLLGSPCDLPYRKGLGKKIAHSLLSAMANLQPARIGLTAVDVPEHVVCRRYYMKTGYQSINPVTGKPDIIKTNPAGAEAYIDKRASEMDTQLSAIAVQSIEGKWISILGNYSMHYVGDCSNGTITADYFGVFSRHIKNFLGAGDDFVGMLSNGTSGDANIWDFIKPDRYPKGDHQKKELIGKDLAEKISQVIQTITWESHPSVSATLKKIASGVRKPTAGEVEAAGKIVANTDYRLLNPDTPALVNIYAREQVLLGEYPDTIEIPVQALKIGDITIGALGGEFFAETGLALKKANHAGKYFTITMANGYCGYIPPAHEIEKGGYETWRCRSSHVKEDGESLVRDTLISLTR